MNIGGGMLIFSLISRVFFIGLFGISIYCFVLFIKLANRGIKALDIYINEKTENKL